MWLSIILAWNVKWIRWTLVLLIYNTKLKWNDHLNICFVLEYCTSYCFILNANLPVQLRGEVKAKCSLYLIKHHDMKAYGEGSEGVAVCIINPSFKYRWEVSFMTRPLYAWVKSYEYPLGKRTGGHDSQSS